MSSQAGSLAIGKEKGCPVLLCLLGHRAERLNIVLAVGSALLGEKSAEVGAEGTRRRGGANIHWQMG